MGDVTSHPLANQAEACLFGRSLNTSLCEIYDHKAAFLLVKTVIHKHFNLHIWKKRTDIIDYIVPVSISIYGKNVPIL